MMKPALYLEGRPSRPEVADSHVKFEIRSVLSHKEAPENLVTHCSISQPSKMHERIDVHCHAVPPRYRQYAIDNGHEKPDGMPALPVRTIASACPPFHLRYFVGILCHISC